LESRIKLLSIQVLQLNQQETMQNNQNCKKKKGQDKKKVPAKRPRLYVFDHERPCKPESQPNPSGRQIWDASKAHLANHPAAPIRRPVNNDTLAPCFSLSLGRTPASSFDGQIVFSLTFVTHFDGIPSVHVLGRSVVTA
jgi:hypothetical protein